MSEKTFRNLIVLCQAVMAASLVAIAVILRNIA